MRSSFTTQVVAVKMYFLFRYLSRVVLVPFAYQPPSVSADILDELLRKACAALPQAIVIGSTLMGFSGEIFKQVAAQIESTLTADGFTIDSRLEMQYAISIVCAQEVYTCCTCTVSSQYSPSSFLHTIFKVKIWRAICLSIKAFWKNGNFTVCTCLRKH